MKHITRHLLVPVVFILSLVSISVKAGTNAEKPADPAIEGRWDITIEDGGKKFPAWLEVIHSGHKRLVGQYVGITGSARPVSIIHFTNGKISFSLPPQWEEEDNDLSFEGTLEGDVLTGVD